MLYQKEFKKPMRWLTGTATFTDVKGIVDEIITLDLSDLCLGNKIVKNLPLPPGLKTLDLSHNNIGDECEGLVLPPGLQELNLFDIKIGDEGVKGLMLPLGLKELHLGGNNIGAEGAKGLELPPGLQTLNLDHNKVSDEVAKD